MRVVLMHHFSGWSMVIVVWYDQISWHSMCSSLVAETSFLLSTMRSKQEKKTRQPMIPSSKPVGRTTCSCERRTTPENNKQTSMAQLFVSTKRTMNLTHLIKRKRQLLLIFMIILTLDSPHLDFSDKETRAGLFLRGRCKAKKLFDRPHQRTTTVLS